jgi:hypothetical protein
MPLRLQGRQADRRGTGCPRVRATGGIAGSVTGGAGKSPDAAVEWPLHAYDALAREMSPESFDAVRIDEAKEEPEK